MQITIADAVEIILAGKEITNVKIIGKINHNAFAKLIHYDKTNDKMYIKHDIIIKKCHIEDIDLRKIHFNNKLEIRYCNVNNTIFSFCHFMKGVNFSTTTFHGSAAFNDAWFHWTAYFSETCYKEEPDFHFAYFKEWAMYHNAFFEQGAFFVGCTFLKRALFPMISGPEISFEGSRIHENFICGIDTERMGKPRQINFKNCYLYDYVSLQNISCESVILEDVNAKDIVDIAGAKFDLINLKNTRINTFVIEMDQLVTKTSWHKPDYFKIEHDNLSQLKTALMMLKRNFQAQLKRDEEDWAYRELRKAETLEHRMNRRIFRYVCGKAIDILFGFGTLPWRALTTSLLVILAYAVVYAILGISSKHQAIISTSSINDLIDCFYFSTITFTTIGYGDISPDGVSRLVAASEGFMGIFMMATFSVAFSRKLLR